MPQEPEPAKAFDAGVDMRTQPDAGKSRPARRVDRKHVERSQPVPRNFVE
jgi:hypothetical protein